MTCPRPHDCHECIRGMHGLCAGLIRCHTDRTFIECECCGEA